MEAISRTKRLLPQKRKNQKIREPLVLKGSLEIICDSSIKLRRNGAWEGVHESGQILGRGKRKMTAFQKCGRLFGIKSFFPRYHKEKKLFLILN